MFSGLAPSQMLDLAAVHAADQERAARERADAAHVRRPRFARLVGTFTR